MVGRGVDRRIMWSGIAMHQRVGLCGALVFAVIAMIARSATADELAELRGRGTLVWGGDSEGGGPYVYPDPLDPRRMTGFEVELAEMLARELGVKAEFFQGPW